MVFTAVFNYLMENNKDEDRFFLQINSEKIKGIR